MQRWQASWLVDEQVPARREPSGTQVVLQLVLLAAAAGCFGLAVAAVFFTGLFVPATLFFGQPWSTESLLAVSAAALAALLLLHRHH
jgi:hypothetical protein